MVKEYINSMAVPNLRCRPISVALDSQATATVGKGMAPDPTNTPWEFAS